MKSHLKKIVAIWNSFDPRERMLAGGASIVIAVTLVYLPITWLMGSIDNSRREKSALQGELGEVSDLAKRHSQLNRKFQMAEASFNKAQVTSEEVAREVDKIVKSSLGNDVKYDFKKPGKPSAIGIDYQKQSFSLSLSSSSLEQIVKLLFKFEQAETPLFLGTIDMQRAGNANQFRTTLNLFSIRKTQG